MIRLLILSLIVLFYLPPNTYGAIDKINERRILLPYNDGVPTNFTLETYGDENSCYKWTSSRPDIASVKLLLDQTSSSSSTSCSKRALVTVVSRIPKRQSTVITAHDVKTNVQIRCDVEVDSISRITIQTTTKEIVYGELPETIRAFAYTDENDIFTSIGGIAFNWTLTPSDVLRYRLWSSSSYASPDFVEYWESLGRKSSMILVEGIKTGSAKIRASLIDNDYSNKVEPSEISLHVVANLLLIPSNDVYMVPGATIHFRAEISKQGPRVPLKFPNEQYYLEVFDTSITNFDETTNVLTALKEGHTSIVLKDRNIISNDSSSTDIQFSRTRTDIHVMTPSFILIDILPGNRFQLITDYEYNVQLSVYDDSHNPLYPSDNFHLDLKIEHNNYIDILDVSVNKTYYRIRTRYEIGATKFIAYFYGAGDYYLTQPLILQQDVTIHPPIALNPQEIYLPLLPLNDSSETYTVYVEATGATGSGYNWQSSDDTLAIIDQSSQKSSRSTIHRKIEPADVWIFCNDIHNSLIFNAKMSIQVLPVDAVEILPSIVEAPIGGEVLIPIAVIANKKGKSQNEKFYFDDCSKLRFTVNIIEKNRIRFNNDKFMPGTGRHSCRSLSFECMASGNSRVTISYNSDRFEDNKISTQAIIGCYKPLKMIHPPNNQVAILTLGASIDLAFEGGPRPWSMLPEGHFVKANAINTKVVELTEIRDRYRFNKDLHIFRAICSQYGETDIEFIVGNEISPTLLNPASTMVNAHIECARPETLIIKPKTKSSCTHQDTQFPLEKHRSHELDVEVLDRQGIAFYNFSTLYLEWSKDVSSGIFEKTNGIHEEVNGALGFPILTRSYQIFSEQTNSLKSVRIRCRITGYHQHRRYTDRFDIRREIELIMMDQLSVTEKNVIILKHNDFRKIVNITQGSGHFSIDWQEKRMVDVELDKNDRRKLIITPILAGSGIITISDLCLNYPPYKLMYSVVEPIDIKIQMIDKIELGHHVKGTFIIIDNRGNRLHSSLHKYLDLSLTSSNNLLTLEDINIEDDYTSAFTVHAKRLGLCRLLIQTQSTKIRTLSAEIEVQIFSPLKIVPNNITLIVGNVFQPNFIGGPQTQRNVKFELKDSNIAITAPAINGPNGLIKALRNGKTTLTASVTSIDNHEYSRAHAEINVSPLRKIQIWAPINQVFVGATIPIYLIGSSSEHETPFMFGHAQPSLKIKWTLSNDKIGTLESSFQNGLSISEHDNVDEIAVRFRAHSIGSVMLKVTVEVTSLSRDPLFEQLYRNKPLTNSIQIQVYPDYVLSVSSPMDSFSNNKDNIKQLTGRSLLMSPQSELLLHQNSMDEVQYRIWNESSFLKLTNKTGDLILQAGDRLEFGSLMIERDLYQTGIMDHFTQTVHVDRVQYLSMELDPLQFQEQVSKSSINLSKFPLGSEISMVVNFYNQLGRKFDSVKSNIKWTMSRQDIITILQSSDDHLHPLKIRSLKEGSVILKMWDDVNQIEQYYKINVDRSIYSNDLQAPYPQQEDDWFIKLHVSDVICMRTKFDKIDDTNNFWYLDQKDSLIPIAWIDSKLGALLALSPGKGMIVYNHTSTRISTYRPFHIIPFRHVSLNTNSIEGISTTAKYIVPIMISGLSSSKQINGCANVGNGNTFNAIEHFVPFACDITFSDGFTESLWNINVEYVPQKGWSCIVVAKNNLDLDFLATLPEKNVTITVVVTTLTESIMPFDQTANEQQQQDIGSFYQIQLPFLPEFRTHVKQILLSSESREYRFLVHSMMTVLKDMSIISSNEDIISVQKEVIMTSEEKSSNSMNIIVSLKNVDIFSTDIHDLHLILQSLLINQTMRIPIQLKMFDRSTFTVTNLSGKLFIGSNSTLESFYTISLIIITMILAFAFWIICRRFVFNQHRIVYIDTLSPFQNNLSQKSPKRVIDYNQTPTTPGKSFSMFSLANQQTPFVSNINNLSISGNLSQNDHHNRSRSSSPTATSPKIGRPLYSTRSIFD